jgi:hypothetical protein
MATKILERPTPEMVDLLRRTADLKQPEAARAAMQELAIALTLPLKQGVLKGDIIGGIYQPIPFEPGAAVEFPLDFLAPGTEKDHVAYTIPGQGKIPERHVEGDYVMVPTYDVADAIDWKLKYARDARWDIVKRAMEVLEAGFIRKNNDDGWHTIIAAAVGRAIVVYDDQAAAGLFTKRLIELGRTIMRRKAGGNSTSVNRGKLTDVFMSPESLGDMRSWDLTQIDDFTRREIFMAGEGMAALTKVFGVLVHDIDELGVGQDYQSYYTSQGGTMPGSKVEIAVGLDLSKSDSFVMPVRQEIQVYEDNNLHRQLRAGLYAFGEHGFTVLDSRRVIALAV